jgi:prepilin-type N-terminal cleavage/methylation domain-containing protein
MASSFRNSRRNASPGFTLLEIAMAMAMVAILAMAVFGFTRGTFMTLESTNSRALTSSQRQIVDVRVGEVARIAPQYGDLIAAGGSALTFRKRHAISATACAYATGSLTVDLMAKEAANLVIGDSLMVRVGQNTADTTDDTWAFARLASVTTAAGCGRPTTLTATLASPPADAAIRSGASVRFWSTRSYAATQIATDSGYALIETVNGGSSTRLFSFFTSPNVFTYLDGTGAAAATPSAVRLVRATFNPYLWQNRARQVGLRENLEWAIRADDDPTLAGTVVITPGAATAQARCTTPGATNFGDTRNVCTFPAVCAAPLSQFTTTACGAGYSGSINYESDKGAAPGCAWGGWYAISNTCALLPCSPASTTYTTGCGAGYTGSITWQQDAGAAPGCVFGGAYQIGNSCVVAVVYGCTNPAATNYNPLATSDNGSCTLPCVLPSPNPSSTPSTSYAACGAGYTGTQSQTCTTTTSWTCPGPSSSSSTACGGWDRSGCVASPPPPPTVVSSFSCNLYLWEDLSGFGDFKIKVYRATQYLMSDGSHTSSGFAWYGGTLLNSALDGTDSPGGCSSW